jgi:hypothetical protein
MPEPKTDRSAIRCVVCAAIRNVNDGTITLGARHFNCFVRALGLGHEYPDEAHEQGFIDQDEKFLTREEAWIVAEAAGQIRHRAPGCDGPELYSENLY